MEKGFVDPEDRIQHYPVLVQYCEYLPEQIDTHRFGVFVIESGYELMLSY